MDFLKYGALGIGAIILFYTAGLLKQELSRDEPRPAGRNLILLFMAFCIFAFVLSGLLEIYAKTGIAEQERRANSNLVSAVNLLDAYLGEKLKQTISELAPSPEKTKLEYYDLQICEQLKAIREEARITSPIKAKCELKY